MLHHMVSLFRLIFVPPPNDFRYNIVRHFSLSLCHSVLILISMSLVAMMNTIEVHLLLRCFYTALRFRDTILALLQPHFVQYAYLFGVCSGITVLFFSYWLRTSIVDHKIGTASQVIALA
jgi:hypothetical protein